MGGRLRVRFGWPGIIFAALLGAALVSSLRAENWFAGLRWCLLLATYGLTAFLVLQVCSARLERGFLVSCLLATAVALAAYSVWHHVLYMPALRRWLALEPAAFRAALAAGAPLARDLEARVAADRLYGSFVTPNQLASFLVIAVFPLLALATGPFRMWRQDRHLGKGGKAARAFGTAASLLMLVALFGTGSRGGVAALLFGAAILLRRHWRKLLAVAVIGGVLAAVAYGTGVVPARGRIAGSLGVRLGYWNTSLQIARERPAFGVGPGSWAEWYAMRKQPEFEETRDAHSLYLQLLAESGAVGLALWLALWAGVFSCAFKGAGRTVSAEPEAGGACRGGRSGARRSLRVAGLGMAALALGFDYAAVGTFLPPRHVPAWLAAAPWLPYALVYAAWAASFLALFGAKRAWGAVLSPWALVAALAAFLLHSGAEFTLVVPAIGGTVAVFGALLLSTGDLPRRREFRLTPAVAALVFAASAAVVVLWAAVPTRRVLAAVISRQSAESMQAELGERGRIAARGRLEKVTEELRQACVAVPWDGDSWRDLGAWHLALARGSLRGGSPARAE
ncbi:MAG: O-antigen ligase family protein, partial [Planctomycetota bacterium]